MTVHDHVARYVEEIAARLAALRSDLVGVYLHGSAVLGGFDPARSDVDVLAVVAGPEGESAQRRTGEAIAATAVRCPGAGLELSVITAATARQLGDCPFEVHVNTTGAEPVIVPGAGAGGDADLVLHAAVCREFGRAVHGPPPGQVFGRPPRQRILAAMVADLRWAIDGGHAGYAVLNACRAARFAEEGRLCSKRDGARWYLARHPDDATVIAALTRHLGGGRGPSVERAVAFVEGSGLTGCATTGE